MMRPFTWREVLIVVVVVLLLVAIQASFYPELFIYWASVVILAACVLGVRSRLAKTCGATLLIVALGAALYATAKSPLFPFRTKIPATHYESVPLPTVLQDLAKKKGHH